MIAAPFRYQSSITLCFVSSHRPTLLSARARTLFAWLPLCAGQLHAATHPPYSLNFATFALNPGYDFLPLWSPALVAVLPLKSDSLYPSSRLPSLWLFCFAVCSDLSIRGSLDSKRGPVRQVNPCHEALTVWYHSGLGSRILTHLLPSGHPPFVHCWRSTRHPTMFVQASSAGVSLTVFLCTGPLQPLFYS